MLFRSEVCDLPSRNQQRERLHILGANASETRRVLALLDEDARGDSSISLTQNVVAAVQGISPSPSAARSAAVNTPFTPGSARAAVASMPRMTAWACGERRT